MTIIASKTPTSAAVRDAEQAYYRAIVLHGFNSTVTAAARTRLRDLLRSERGGRMAAAA